MFKEGSESKPTVPASGLSPGLLARLSCLEYEASCNPQECPGGTGGSTGGNTDTGGMGGSRERTARAPVRGQGVRAG